MFRPIASSAAYPNNRSAAAFHEPTSSFRSRVTTAVGLSSKSAE